MRGAVNRGRLARNDRGVHHDLVQNNIKRPPSLKDEEARQVLLDKLKPHPREEEERRQDREHRIEQDLKDHLQDRNPFLAQASREHVLVPCLKLRACGRIARG